MYASGPNKVRPALFIARSIIARFSIRHGFWNCLFPQRPQRNGLCTLYRLPAINILQSLAMHCAFGDVMHTRYYTIGGDHGTRQVALNINVMLFDHKLLYRCAWMRKM